MTGCEILFHPFQLGTTGSRGIGWEKTKYIIKKGVSCFFFNFFLSFFHHFACKLSLWLGLHKGKPFFGFGGAKKLTPPGAPVINSKNFLDPRLPAEKWCGLNHPRHYFLKRTWLTPPFSILHVHLKPPYPPTPSPPAVARAP